MPVTLRDVAGACGVDISTVSRALRNDNRVKEATRRRIARIAGDMGYVPNLSARSLAGARTGTIWYLTPSIQDPIQMEAIPEASHYLAEHQYELSIILYQHSTERYLHLLRRLGQGVTDGVIIVPGPTDDRGARDLAVLTDKGFPLVFLDRHPKGTEFPTVTSDNAGGAAELVRMLQAQGAQQFVVLFQREGNPVEQARLHGAVECLGQAGSPFVFGDRFTQSFLQHDTTLGLIATNPGTVRRFLREKLPAPPQLLAAVFDDWQGDPFPAAQTFVCRQDLVTMARKACDLILEMIDGNRPSKSMHRIPPAGFETFKTQVH